MQKEIIISDDSQNDHLLLPDTVWYQIFIRTSDRQASFFGGTCRYLRQLFIDYISGMFRYTKFDARKIFQDAERAGVKLNLPLLYRLCNTHESGDLFYSLILEKDPTWCIAAICGDVTWLIENVGAKFFNQMTAPGIRQKGILFFITMGGHLDIIEKYFGGILRDYNNTRDAMWIRDINYVAGRVGHFHICDHLEKHYQVKPNRRFGSKKSTIHFYAQYGKRKRLKTALKDYPEISQDGYLIHDAAQGGHISTVDYLASKFPEDFHDVNKRIHETCVHIAAEFGHPTLLQHLIKHHKLDPCRKNSVGLTPLELSTTTGQWDCFWILYPYYDSHPERDRILASAPHVAVGQNRMHFIRQYIKKFGNACIKANNAYGKPISFELLASKNMRMVKMLVNEYGMDLTQKSTDGETAILYMAELASKRKIETLWLFIADIVKEFHPTLCPNEQERLQLLIEKDGKQALFTPLSLQENPVSQSKN